MGSSILPGVLDIGGSLVGGASASSAAGDQLAATNAGIAEKKREFNVTQSEMQPWLQTGQNALAELSGLLGLPSSPTAGNSALLNSYEQELNSLTSGAAGSGQTVPTSAGQVGGVPWYTWASNPRLAAVEASGAGSTTPATPANQARINYLRGQIDKLRTQAGQPTVQSSAFGYLTQPYGAMNLANDPGFQFRLDQGKQALEHSAAARGDILSGAEEKALARYSQDYASNEYNNAFNQDAATKNRIYNYLSGTAGTGASTAANLGNLGAANSNAIANLLTQGGNASAAGTAAMGSSLAGGLTNTANYLRLQSLLRAPVAAATPAPLSAYGVIQ